MTGTNGTSGTNGAELLTNTARGTYGECARKYYWSYVLGIKPYPEPTYFRFGRNYHKGLEVLGKTGDLGQAVAAVRARYEEVPGWVNTQEDGLFEWMLECEKVVRLLCGWAWRWQDEPVEIVQTEGTFRQPIINPETGAAAKAHENAGVRDQLVRHGGVLKLREFKTASEDLSADADYWKHLRLDHQISAYYDSYHAEGIDVAEVLYDVVRKPSIKPKNPVKKDLAEWPVYYGETIKDAEDGPPEKETVQMYGARLTADMYERPEFYYQRMSVPRLEADQVEFRQDLWAKHQQIMHAKRHGIWPREPRSCFKMGRCPFFDLCTGGYGPGVKLPSGFRQAGNVHPELEEHAAEEAETVEGGAA